MRLILTILICSVLFLTGCKVDNTGNVGKKVQGQETQTKTKAPIPTTKANTKLTHQLRRSSNNNTTDPMLILLHGLGSSEGDMVNLGKNLNRQYHIVSLRAPISIGENKNSWYDYGPQADQAKANGQMDTAAKDIVQTINQLKKQYQLNPQKILIGGFSQGGIMSYHTALTHPTVFSGVMPMSGKLSEYTKTKISKDVSYKPLKFHITHGTEDRRILYTDGQKAYHVLRSKGMTATFKPYKGGHNIPQECYESINGKLGEWN